MNKFKNACRSSCEEWADSLELSCDSQFSQEFEEKMETLTGEIKVHKYRRPAKRTATLLINAAVILCFCATMFALPLTREKLFGIFRDDVYDSGVSDGNSANIWSDDKDYGSEINSGDTDRTNSPDISYGSDSSGNADNQNDERNEKPTDGDDMYEGGGTPSYEELEVNLGYIPDGFSFDDSPLACGPEDDAQTEPKRKYYKNGDSRFDISKYTADISSKDEKYTTVKIDGIDYDVVERTDTIFVFWNKESAYFILRGTNISRDELLKIASNAK